MSRPKLFITIFCVSLVLLAMITVAGCASTSSGSATAAATASPAATAAASSAASTGSSQSASCDFNFIQPRYGMASNPSVGIDAIAVFVTSGSGQGDALDFTECDLVFSTSAAGPVTLTKGTTESTSTYTVTTEGNLKGVATIKFNVKPVPGNTKINICFRPSGTTKEVSCVVGGLTVPQQIFKTNQLY
jgi:hypothetical protein